MFLEKKNKKNCKLTIYMAQMMKWWLLIGQKNTQHVDWVTFHCITQTEWPWFSGFSFTSFLLLSLLHRLYITQCQKLHQCIEESNEKMTTQREAQVIGTIDHYEGKEQNPCSLRWIYRSSQEFMDIELFDGNDYTYIRTPRFRIE